MNDYPCEVVSAFDGSVRGASAAIDEGNLGVAREKIGAARQVYSVMAEQTSDCGKMVHSFEILNSADDQIRGLNDELLKLEGLL
ncbi:hypothetical protein K8R30_00120 [archaeon]|nr:hypothetical protein [archaeon]